MDYPCLCVGSDEKHINCVNCCSVFRLSVFSVCYLSTLLFLYCAVFASYSFHVTLNHMPYLLPGILGSFTFIFPNPLPA